MEKLGGSDTCEMLQKITCTHVVSKVFRQPRSFQNTRLNVPNVGLSSEPCEGTAAGLMLPNAAWGMSDRTEKPPSIDYQLIIG